MSQYENTSLINRQSDELIIAAKELGYEGELLDMLTDPKTSLKSNEERVRLNQAVARELEKKQSNQETTSEAKQSTETQTETFCSISIDQLTFTQKKLFDRLTPAQREKLAQKVSINKIEGQIEFLQIKKAIKDTDLTQNVTKVKADEAIKNLGNGWELPRDVDYTDANRLTLDPTQSDYDAMILQMPGNNNNEKVENFRLLTGMNGRYWTAQNYNESSSLFVLRRFNEVGRNRSRNNDDVNIHVRPVRPL